MGLSRFVLLEKDNTESSWDEFWKSHDVRRIASLSKKRIIRILSDYVRPNMNILDVGCGTGFFSSYFISQRCKVYSMDYSQEALSITKDITRDDAKMYIRGDILNKKILSDINTRFDIIFTDGLLEHYSIDKQDKLIMNMKTLKREDGYIINFAPNRHSLWSVVRPFFINIKERPFHRREFLELHLRNDLKIISSGGVNVLPFKLSPERLLGRYFGMLFYCIAI